MTGGAGRGHEHPIPEPHRPRRHCWVTGPPEAPGPHAGIVLEWQQREGQWWARVSYLVEDDGALVQQWLSAELVTPA